VDPRGGHVSRIPAKDFWISLPEQTKKIPSIIKSAKDLLVPTFLVFSPLPMAKTAWLERNKRKQKTVEKYAALRAELKAKKDYASLAQLPRDASPTRLVNRCRITGRRRAFLRRFQISRITFRELASNGMIPGVTKSSW
jgi:small subunit ribosomal protein S14